MSSKIIFLVDDNLTNLTMGKNALKDTYKTFTMPSALKMFELLPKVRPDLILLDVKMPEMSGFQAIEILKRGENADIPVIFLTADDDKQSEEEGIALGALDYIQKPFSCEDLTTRIEKALQ
ncbi:MAG: hypothetical protein Ta2B_06860 [Termitinemataceae bacterium]|nr:MAG: hypothetical protein Ta2B_06860 [Termitinemataceae bacterium]